MFSLTIRQHLLTLRKIAVFALLPVVMAFSSGCDQESDTEGIASGTIPATTAVAGVATVDEELPVSITGDRQLVLWIPPFFQAPFAATDNDPLAQLLAQFERDNPGVHVDVQTRSEAGDANMLSYLRSAQRLAPTILPDIILIDTQQLWQVAELGLAMPLQQTQLLTDTVFFPQLLAATSYNDDVLGYPYVTDYLHTISRRDQVDVIPTTWSALQALGAPYLFAGGRGDGINEFVYLQYLGAGGSFDTEALLNDEQLLSLFTTLQQVQLQGLFPAAVLETATMAHTWELFMTQGLGLAETSSSIMLAHLDTIGGEPLAYGPIPTVVEDDVTLARVWAFSIVTDDAEQRELSLALMAAFLQPTIQSEISLMTMHVPTQPAAFELWRKPSPYFDFLQTQIAQASALPNGRRFVELNRRLHAALELLLQGEMTPEDAVSYVKSAP